MKPLREDDLWVCPRWHVQEMDAHRMRRFHRNGVKPACQHSACLPRNGLPRSPQERKAALLKRVHRGHYRPVYTAWLAGGLEAAQEVFTAMKAMRLEAARRYAGT